MLKYSFIIGILKECDLINKINFFKRIMMNKGKYLIEKAPINKTIMLLVIPAILGSLVAQFNFIIDTFFLSRLDTGSIEATAATGVVFPIVLLIMAFANMFAIGGSIYGAQIFGTGDEHKTRSVFSGVVRLAVISNIILIIILAIFLVPILNLIGASSETLNLSYNYAIVVILGSPTTVLSFLFVMFTRSEGNANIGLISIVIQTLINVVLNFVFIFIFGWSTFGAAFATVISQGVQTLICGYSLFIGQSNFKYIKGTIDFTKEDRKKVVELGFPATVVMLYMTLTSALMSFEASKYESDVLIAVIGVLVKFFTMINMLIQAAVSGIQPVFSYCFGSGNKQRFLETKKAFTKYLIIACAGLGLLLILVPTITFKILPVEGGEEYMAFGTMFVGIMMLFLPMSYMYQILFQSVSQGKRALQIVTIRQFIVFLVINPILLFSFGIQGILISQQTSVIVGSIIVIIIYKKRLNDALNTI